MLEQLLIFTKGGLILWACRVVAHALKGSPVNSLIRAILLEERSGSSFYEYNVAGVAYTLKWTFNNDLALVFVAVYQQVFHLMYVDELLSNVKYQFSSIYSPNRTTYVDFNDTFRQLCEEAEARAEEMKKAKQTDRPITAFNMKLAQKCFQSSRSQHGGGDKSSRSKEGDSDDPFVGDQKSGSHESPHSTIVTNKENNKPAFEAFDVNKLQKVRAKSRKKADVANNKVSAPKSKKTTVKKNRVWSETPSEAKLDFTDQDGQIVHDNALVPVVDKVQSLMDKEEVVYSENESEEDEESVQNFQTIQKKGWFTSMFKSIAGNTTLEKLDLEPVLKTLKDKLMSKNVAEEIAEKLCESVLVSLEGKKLGSFTRISSTAQVAMEEALIRILTPKRSIDILSDICTAKEQGKPYVIVFVGVNGVGKSTNLAKVAYWLLQHHVSVTMAACDTFRSGAVEQLRTHARRLQIPIFEKGYEKDPAVVAKEAIQDACNNKSNVVLVDTAGRMQDNEPLMRALSKLIYINNPDLVLFVGEALVGNDAVDQLSKFNQKLADLSPVPSPRLIDGILLTKFDTIDDKVGAALSMVYVSGAPIMFVGCGQSYTDLKKINIKSIVNTLLK